MGNQGGKTTAHSGMPGGKNHNSQWDIRGSRPQLTVGYQGVILIVWCFKKLFLFLTNWKLIRMTLHLHHKNQNSLRKRSASFVLLQPPHLTMQCCIYISDRRQDKSEEKWRLWPPPEQIRPQEQCPDTARAGRSQYQRTSGCQHREQQGPTILLPKRSIHKRTSGYQYWEQQGPTILLS